MYWINVKDRLPEKGMMIIYCSNTNIVSSIGIYWDDPQDPRGPVPSRPDYLTWKTVTHWMPLPEVPQINLTLDCGFNPPPWEINEENADKTFGWIEYQRYERDMK